MASQKSHIVCIPAPLQGHLNPMIKLAKLLHSKGFYITLVLTEFDFAKLTSSMSVDFLSLQSLHDFRIESISDGMPSDNKRGAIELEEMVVKFFWGDQLKNVVRSLLKRLLASHDIPPISSVILDCVMFFPLGVCKEFGIEVLIFFTTSACAMLAFMQYDELVERGLFPSKDENYLTNGYLDIPIDWVPTLIKGTKMKHLPTYVRSTNPNETIFKFLAEGTRQTHIADGIILNTFANLEASVLETIKAKATNKLFVVGPFALLCQQHELLPLTLSLWKEDTTCLEWLNTRSPKSVIYVNFGSLAILSLDQLKEFAWGLANSNHPFLWVIRSDLVEGVSRIIDEEYMEEIKERGLIVSWCSQEKVLKHPSIAAFLTHCGWNSMLESICEGVPMICWPCFSDQPTNCLYACQDWGVGIEMEEGEVRRGKVEEFVREMMEGEKGKELRRNALEWKKKAQEATSYGGSSNNDFDELVKFLIKKDIRRQST